MSSQDKGVSWDVGESTSPSFSAAPVLGSFTKLLGVVSDVYRLMVSRGSSSGEASYGVSVSGSSSDVVPFKVVAM